MNNLCRCPTCNGYLSNDRLENIAENNCNGQNETNVTESNCINPNTVAIIPNVVNTIERNSNNQNIITNNSTEQNVINAVECNSNQRIVNTGANNSSNSNIINTNRNNFPNISLLNVLYNYIGRKCTCEFNTSRGSESKTGVLESVGTDFLSLRSLNSNKIIYCRICNLLFVTVIC